jgi:hypothetical protein
MLIRQNQVAPRGDVFIQSIHNYNDLKRGAYHCDLVVAKRPGELDVIGGNVADAVSMAHIKLDAYSGPKLPPIPAECCHPFHFKAATYSGECCHPLKG